MVIARVTDLSKFLFFAIVNGNLIKHAIKSAVYIRHYSGYKKYLRTLLSFNEAFLYSALLFFLTISNLYSRMKIVPTDTKLNTVPRANLLSFSTIIDDRAR